MIINTNSIKSNKILFGSMGDNSLHIQTMLDNIKRTFKLSPSYYQITKYPENTTLYDVWIVEKTDDEEKDGVQKKKILMYPDQNLEYGDYINWQEEIWLTVDKSISPYYDNGNLQKCNNKLKFKNKQGEYVEYPCVISFMSRDYLNIQQNNTLLTPKDIYVVKLQLNDDTKNIIESERFIIETEAFKCIAISNILVKNILEIKIQQDLIRGTDDLVNRIADQTIEQPTTPVTSTLTITGSEKIHTTSSGTYNLSNTVNGVTYTWSLTTITDTALASNIATITTSTNSSITIKAGSLASQQFYIKVVGSDGINAKLLVSTTSGFS